MSYFEINAEILDQLIRIGRTERFELLSQQSGFTPYHGQMMRLAPAKWYRTAESLSAVDLIALIKCLTIAERELKGWGGGSASAVIWLFKKLHGFDHRLKVELTNWILSNTKNEYVPFGTINYGARSLDEYNAFDRAAWEKMEERRKAEENRQKAAKQQKALKATYNLIGAIKRKDTIAIEALLAKGADPKAAINGGVSALELASSMNDRELVALLDNL